MTEHETWMESLGRAALALAVLCLIGVAACNDTPAPMHATAPAAAASAPTLPKPSTVAESAAVSNPSDSAVVATAARKTSPEADSLFAALTAPDVSPEQWEKSQARLIELGDNAVPTLAREVASDDPFHREVAASSLAMLGSAAAGATSELRAALADKALHVRANAATALCAIPEQAGVVIPVLTELLRSDDPQIRQMSAVNLSSFGEEAAPHVTQLVAILKTAPEDVIVPVVELLGRIGPQAGAAAAQLQQIAFEQEGDAKQAAQAALERINVDGR